MKCRFRDTDSSPTRDRPRCPSRPRGPWYPMASSDVGYHPPANFASGHPVAGGQRQYAEWQTGRPGTVKSRHPYGDYQEITQAMLGPKGEQSRLEHLSVHRIHTFFGDRIL